jgi:hypothetical protein
LVGDLARLGQDEGQFVVREGPRSFIDDGLPSDEKGREHDRSVREDGERDLGVAAGRGSVVVLDEDIRANKRGRSGGGLSDEYARGREGEGRERDKAHGFLHGDSPDSRGTPAE